MPPSSKPEFQFDLTGGQLALDLANTVSRRDEPERRKDHLESCADLIAFGGQSQVVPPRQAQELRGYALTHSLEARRTFARAITLREAIYRVFSTIAQGGRANADDLRTIGEQATEALRHRALEPGNGGYRWTWISPNNRLDLLVWAAAKAAADLLTSDELRIVRFCEAPDCQWLFLDRSRNRSRRWCDMTSCGNRAKARRHYQRRHD